MRGVWILTACSWSHFASAVAQPPSFDPGRVNVPDQFYTNGVHIDAWNPDEAKQQIVTLWFGKNPKDSISFRQLVAICKDNQTDKIYYYDLVGRRYVGRYDMRTDKYSVLSPEHRLRNLNDIKEEWFPPRDEMPAIGDLFDPPAQGRANDDRLMEPPVTVFFPRLKGSNWEGFYTDIGAHRRRRMTLKFNGNTGSFAAQDVNVTGRLSNLLYGNDEKGLFIRGDWSAGGVEGSFEFRISPMNLNEFQGDYWVDNRPGSRFLWDGHRTSR